MALPLAPPTRNLKPIGPPARRGPSEPGSNCQRWVEGFQPFYDAIATATAAGIVVVEAAGNGGVDLDGIDCEGLFDRTDRDSGAILAGARDPTDNSRLPFSNHGSRLDLQGWGRLVVTTGYGDLFGRPPGPADLRQRYTAQFSGTSSAAAIVAGAALAVQGARTAAGLPALAPAALRQLLVDTGTPQAPSPSGRIGPLPNLPAALARAVPCAAPTAIPPAGGTVTGRTAGQGALQGCGGEGPERVFEWTPSASGTASIETCGSLFDTVLSVRRDACATGSEIACADDVCGRQERVTLEVTAGVPYFIVVDGFRSAEGQFVLRVTPLPPEPTTTSTSTTSTSGTSSSTATTTATLGPTTTTTTAPACATGPPCDDRDACTVDACDPRAGCISSPRPASEPAGVACAADNALAALRAPPAPACSGRCPDALAAGFEKAQALLDASATAPGRARCARTLRRAVARTGRLRRRIERLAARGRLDSEARALALVREATRLSEGGKRLVAERYCAFR